MDLSALKDVMNGFVPFNVFLGIRVTEMDRGRARLEVPFREEFIGDPVRRALHGGLISTLADTAGGAALWSMADEPHTRVSTIDLRVDYLRPGRPETLVAEAQVVRAGKRVGVVDVRLFHPSAPADTVATGKGVYNIVRGKKAEPG